jgi:hypothetical protein
MGKPPETTASTLPANRAIHGAKADERVTEHGESLEPNRLHDRDEIIGKVADPITSIHVEPAATGEPAWACDDHREALDERAEIEVIRPGNCKCGRQQRRA